jgi:hypothetical protein
VDAWHAHIVRIMSKVCLGYGLDLPVEAFRCKRTGAQGRDARCKQCKAERKPPEPPEVPDVSPARVLHLELRRARERGEPFELGWPKARVKVLQLDSSWSKALQWSQPEWRPCYERSGRPAVQPDALKPNEAA